MTTKGHSAKKTTRKPAPKAKGKVKAKEKVGPKARPGHKEARVHKAARAHPVAKAARATTPAHPGKAARGEHDRAGAGAHHAAAGAAEKVEKLEKLRKKGGAAAPVAGPPGKRGKEKSAKQRRGDERETDEAEEGEEAAAPEAEEADDAEEELPQDDMSDITERSEVKELMARGREKGFLTYDEVNDALPSDIGSDQIDDVMSMFGEHDIEVVDGAEKKMKLPDKPPEPEAKAEAEEEKDEDDDAGYGKSNDPVRMYLRKMGSVSLLTREGEVEIAKRIEDGEKEVLAAVLSSSIAIREIAELGERLRKGKIRVREIIKDAGDEQADTRRSRRRSSTRRPSRPRQGPATGRSSPTHRWPRAR